MKKLDQFYAESQTILKRAAESNNTVMMLSVIAGTLILISSQLNSLVSSKRGEGASENEVPSPFDRMDF